MRKKLISISIPVYNEEENLLPLYERLLSVTENLKGRYDFEFFFTDNNSEDSSWQIIKELSDKDKQVRGLKFSKNIGFQKSIMVNYLNTTGDAAMQLDADLQDPPELLGEFLKLWEEGYKVVYGIRTKRKEHFVINAFRKFGYYVVDALSENSIPPDAGDFRLVDRRIINELARVHDQFPYIRGSIPGLGFKQIGIPYERSSRKKGKSKFKFRDLLSLGFDGIFNHSTIPLRMATFLGAIVLGLSILGSIYYLFLKAFNPGLSQGLASSHILILFSIGLNSLFLGIIGEYIRRIYINVKSPPIAIVEESLNIEESAVIEIIGRRK
jgi:glycosyltransferase involved in cell wall biosynthesis